MQKNLLLMWDSQAPAAINDAGISTLEQLTCLDTNDQQQPFKIIPVIIQQGAGTTVEEVSAWISGTTYYATKIINVCTGDYIYVKDYISDVIPFLDCCSGDQEHEVVSPVTIDYVLYSTLRGAFSNQNYFSYRTSTSDHGYDITFKRNDVDFPTMNASVPPGQTHNGFNGFTGAALALTDTLTMTIKVKNSLGDYVPELQVDQTWTMQDIQHYTVQNYDSEAQTVDIILDAGFSLSNSSESPFYVPAGSYPGNLQLPSAQTASPYTLDLTNFTNTDTGIDTGIGHELGNGDFFSIIIPFTI